MSVVRIPTSPLPQRFLITLAAGQTYQMVTQYRDAPVSIHTRRCPAG